VQNTSGALWQCPRPATPPCLSTLFQAYPSLANHHLPLRVYGVTGSPSYAIYRHENRPRLRGGTPFNRVKNSIIPFFQGYVSLHVIVAPSKQDTSPIEPSFSSGAAACVQVTRQHTKPRAPRSFQTKARSLCSCFTYKLSPDSFRGNPMHIDRTSHSIHAHQCTPAVPPD
jgi:hypothetical protein